MESKSIAPLKFEVSVKQPSENVLVAGVQVGVGSEGERTELDTHAYSVHRHI